ncbi:MAG: WD40/YVTN/BNR-like repeat-containing protein, partial [Ignavibacteria bacterium]
MKLFCPTLGLPLGLTLGITVLSFTYLNELSAQEFWLRQQTPTTKFLYQCDFADSLFGWAVGDSGIILHTSNGGLNWIIQNSNLIFPISSVFFLNKRLGWAIANNYFAQGTTVLSTTNSGLNWNGSVYPDSTIYLNTIKFLDSLNGWMAGFGGTFLQTTNGGINWLRRPTDTLTLSTFPVKELAFYNSMLGYAVGGVFDYSGVIWRTTNSGMLWTSTGVGPEPVFDIVVLDAVRAIGVGGDFEFGASVIKTTNAGNNWTYETINIFGVAYAVAFRTPAEVWLPLGFSLKWALSTDSARNWFDLQAPDSSALNDALFTDPFHGWAVGDNGSVYKYNASLIGINNLQNRLPAVNKLYQNFPNPFNPFTTIQYYLSKPSRVKIIVYDLLGREVK